MKTERGRSFWGKYRGLVVDNRDPKKLGRIRAICPEIMGTDVDGKSQALGWALPCFPFGSDRIPGTQHIGASDHGAGIFAVPNEDSGVWLEFEAGDINRPIWSGVWHANPLAESGDDYGTDEGRPRPATTPKEAFDSSDPDGGYPDYPVEKVLKAERWTVSAFRRLLLTLDLPPNDPVGVTPHISLGRPGNDPESGKVNKHDIEYYARDHNTHATRDVIDLADRDIIMEALRNLMARAGELMLLVSNPNQLESGPDLTEDQTASLWGSDFPLETTKTKVSAWDTLMLMSRFKDVLIGAGSIGGLYEEESPPSASVGRNVIGAATNGIVLEAFLDGTLDPRGKKAIHLLHRGDELPFQSTANPPIEAGRRWDPGTANRYLPPNGSVAMPPSKTFERLLTERAAPSYNAHQHEINLTFEIPPVDADIKGSFILYPGAYPAPHSPGSPGPTPGWGTPNPPAVTPGPGNPGPSGPPWPGGGTTPGTTNFPPPAVGGGMYSVPGPGDPEEYLTGGSYSATAPFGDPLSSIWGGWDPYGGVSGMRGVYGTLETIAGTPLYGGALGQIGVALDTLIEFCSRCFGLDWESSALGTNGRSFADFSAKWFYTIEGHRVMDPQMPSMDHAAKRAMPFYVEPHPVLSGGPPPDYGHAAVEYDYPDIRFGGRWGRSPVETYPDVIPDPFLDDPGFEEGSEIYDDYGQLGFGERVMSRRGSVRGGLFSGTARYPGQIISISAKTTPPCPPERWIPTYHTPADAWGTAVPGIVPGPVPYPGSSTENRPVMTELIRAN